MRLPDGEMVDYKSGRCDGDNSRASNRSTLLMFKQLELVLLYMKASIKITSLLIEKCVRVSSNAGAEVCKHQLRSVNAACLAVSPVSARRRLLSGTGSLNQLYFYAPAAGR
jgi:hypothetical protein